MNINMNPNGELVQSAVNAPGVIEIPDSFIAEAKQFRELMMMYTCAIRETKTKLEVLNDELAVRNQRNPIQMIKSRVKKPSSITEKLKRRGLPVNVQSVSDNLDDVAGIRVICSFVDDIYTVANMLARQDDVEVVMVKDYIRSPKVRLGEKWSKLICDRGNAALSGNVVEVEKMPAFSFTCFTLIK